MPRLSCNPWLARRYGETNCTQVIPGFGASRNYAFQVPAKLETLKHCCETRDRSQKSPHGKANRVRPRVNQDPDHRSATIDLLAAGVRRDDLYIDHGVSGARASRPHLDAAINALHEGDTLVVTTLDRLGRSTVNLLALPAELKQRGAALRVLNLGGDNVDTSTPMEPVAECQIADNSPLYVASRYQENTIGCGAFPAGCDCATGSMGAMMFTVMAALAQMELEIKRKRITDSVSKRRAAPLCQAEVRHPDRCGVTF